MTLINQILKNNPSLSGTDKIFGSEHTWFGTSNRDIILKTRGKVKVLWGNKFIDIIKDGKINIDVKDPFYVYETKSQIDYSKDGLVFIIDEESFYLIYNGIEYPLTVSDNEYVAFKESLTTTPIEKLTALNNLGIVFIDKSEYLKAFDSDEISAGMFVYILEDGLYFIDSSGELSNPYYLKTGGEILGKVIISTSDETALEMSSGKNIKIGNTLYSSNKISFNDEFKLNNSVSFYASRAIINLITTIKEVISNYIHSSDFELGKSGFGIYRNEEGLAIFEADKFIERSPDENLITSPDVDGTDNFYVSKWCDIIDAEKTEDLKIKLTLSKLIFDVGDIGRVSYHILIDPLDTSNFYKTYSSLHIKAFFSNLAESNYTVESFSKFKDIINTYNTSLPNPPFAINPDDGSDVNISIDLSNIKPIILPDLYTTLQTDTFDFSGKIITLLTALSKLVSTQGDNLDITINLIQQLNVIVTLSLNIDPKTLIGKKIFKIQGNVLRIHLEGESEGNMDLYTNVNNLDDMKFDNINTRIGDLSKFIELIVEDSPIPSEYGTHGIYSKHAYFTGGVIRNDDGSIRIDLTIPQNSLISHGKLKSLDGSIVIDLDNNTILLPLNLLGVTDYGNVTTNTIVAAEAINGNELTTLDQVKNIIKDSEYITWLKTELGL